MTKLAVEHVVRSKRVLASLFHISLIYAHHLHDRDDCLIEINPRHVKFYETMLGFEPMGETKMCRRVNAPARLLRLDLGRADAKIALFGGHADGYPWRAIAVPVFLLQGGRGGNPSAGSAGVIASSHRGTQEPALVAIRKTSGSRP